MGPSISFSDSKEVFFKQRQLPVDSVSKFGKIVVFCSAVLFLFFLVFFFNVFVLPLFLGFASIHEKNCDETPEMAKTIHGAVE